MTGKLFGILLMALLAILAWKWLRAGSARPPAPRSRGHGRQEDEQHREKVIELQQDADGVYRPKNDQDRTKP